MVALKINAPIYSQLILGNVLLLFNTYYFLRCLKIILTFQIYVTTFNLNEKFA